MVDHNTNDTVLGVDTKTMLDALIAVHDAGHNLPELQEEQGGNDGPLTRAYLEKVTLPALEHVPKEALVAIILHVLDDWRFWAEGDFDPCTYFVDTQDQLRDHITSNN